MPDGDIVVVAPPMWTPVPDHSAPQTDPPTQGPPPPGTPGGPPPTWLEPQATAFSELHVNESALDLTVPRQKYWADRIKAAIKGLYFHTQFNFDPTVSLANGEEITASALATKLRLTTIVLTTADIVENGAQAQQMANGTYQITIDIDHAVMQLYQQFWGEVGIHFVILHELGHVVNPEMTCQNDASTNAFGLGTWAYIGLPPMADMVAHGIHFSPF